MIVVAGSTGHQGKRVVAALRARNAQVRALIREGSDARTVKQLKEAGAETVVADFSSSDNLATALAGGTCVVSTLLGLREVIVDAQTTLLQAAVKANVPRFIPSDYAIDFTKITPGKNRNLDLHREFQQRLDAVAEVKATSILCGAFMDLLKGEAPMIQRQLNLVLYWQDPDQLLDFTTRDDTARFTAAAALDDAAPRFLRIAGDVVSARRIATLMTDITGRQFRLANAGSVNALRTISNVVRTFTPPSDNPFPAWQGMQYFADMFEGKGKLHPLDNSRYGDMPWTTLATFLNP